MRTIAKRKGLAYPVPVLRFSTLHHVTLEDDDTEVGAFPWSLKAPSEVAPVMALVREREGAGREQGWVLLEARDRCQARQVEDLEGNRDPADKEWATAQGRQDGNRRRLPAPDPDARGCRVDRGGRWLTRHPTRPEVGMVRPESDRGVKRGFIRKAVDRHDATIVYG